MKKHIVAVLAAFAFATGYAQLDPDCVVAEWSEQTALPVIDINFSDTFWPNSWAGETGRDCPDYTDGGYVNAVIDVVANGGGEVKYPVLFHNCTFATKESYNGYAGATAAFCRQYYLGESAAGNSTWGYNNWTKEGHKKYLEDNIRTEKQGRKEVPVYGEAGFVQMCRNAAMEDATGTPTSMHGWMEIDHIPYVETVQWSWSSTSWGRGIKCDIKIGDGEWTPLVWMGSERQKQGWTVFSDQGYFMENVVNAADVSLRWRVWDGEDLDHPVQTDADGVCPFSQRIDPMAQMQAPRVHKIKIYGSEITAEQADYARANPVADIGEPSDLSDFGFGSGDEKPAPDDNAPVVFYTVDSHGRWDYTSVQAAIDAVPDGYRGIIYILPGIYEENIYCGTNDKHDKFISLIGHDAGTTILTSGTDRGSAHPENRYTDCAALNVFTDRFHAENLTIRNTAGRVGQAEALYTKGDAHTFTNCLISGHQDTYKASDGARGYFRGCTIEGTVDFIYDGGLEWFDNCEIRCLEGGGYITAPGTCSKAMTRVMYPQLDAEVFYPGLFFSNCNVTAADNVADGSYTLGRPWKEMSGAMFLGCTLGSHISPSGWTAWNGSENKSSLWEYNNVKPDGTRVDTSRRASFSRQATEGEVDAYCNPEFLYSNFSDIPFNYSKILGSANAPANFAVTGGNITWDATDAVGYLVYCGGDFVGFTDKPLIESPEADAEYTVKAVSRYGVTSSSVKAEETLRMPAFPTAEGFGKYATGGRGGKVVKVTKLADDGSAGTLRWAFEQHKGEPITIIFEVSGDIALNRELRVNRSDWTLAGQSAPGEGVVITRNKVNLGGSSNFIVRNMRFRIGQKDVNGNIQAENALGAENCALYIFDHCSFGWSVEENMNTADSHFLTVQHSIVHEGLYDAGHSKGVRGYGCQWGGSPATYHHNLLAHNHSRSCRFNGARGEDQVVFIEYANNVNYNYGSNGGCYGGENTADISNYNGLNSAHECNFMNNYYYPGPGSIKGAVTFVVSSYARSGAKSWGPSIWYVAGNIAHGLDAYTADNWKGVAVEGYKQSQARSDERIFPSLPYYKYTSIATVGNYIPEHYMLENVEDAQTAYENVVAHSGTVNRDKVEARVANEARTGTATYGGASLGISSGFIDTEADAEGFFAYSSDYTVALDSDGDGMPDEWETLHRLDPSKADNNIVNADGYTALEVYLASLMGEDMDSDFSTGIEAVYTPVDVRYDADACSIVLGGDAQLRVAVYGTDGRMLKNGVAKGSYSVQDMPSGVLLVQVWGANHASRILKIVKK